MEEHTGRREALRMLKDADPPNKTEHLLRVAGSVTTDAANVWAQLWNEFKPHVTAAGTVMPSIEKGFVPSCGWPEFLERLWLLKHYLDQTGRICQGKH